MIRTLYPVDLPSVLFSSGRIPPNQAIACDNLNNTSPVSPEAFIEHWLPVRLRRHTWISFRGGRVVGLVSIKFSATSSAWHVDCLRADVDRCAALLDEVGSAAARRNCARAP